MTSLTKQVAKHTIIQVAGRFLSLLLGIFVISLILRYLGPEQYGYYSISIAYLQMFGIVVDFGLYLITLKYMGEIDAELSLSESERKNKSDFILQNIFTLRFFSAIFFYGLACLVSLFFSYPLAVKIGVAILSLSLFFSTLIQLLAAIYQKNFDTSKIIIGELIGRVICLGLIIIFAVLNLGFYYILSAFIFSSAANFLFLLFKTRRYFKLKFSFDFSLWKNILIQAWPVGLGIILNTIYFKADTLILSAYRSATEVGLYGACYRVFEVLITFPPLFLGLVFAQVSRAWTEGNTERFKYLLQKSFDFLIAISLPTVLFVLFLGPRIMKLVGGQEFVESGKILRVIIVATGILFMAELFKQTIVNLNQQKNILKFYLFTAIFSLTGYFIFIPRYSYWGAAGVTVATEFLMFILLVHVIRRASGFSPNLRFFSKALLAGLGMVAILAIFYHLNLFILTGLAWLIYLICLYYLKGFDRQVWRSLFNKKEQ
ncbi:MAG: flippase [Patescibacteria group bacterium]|nr:flippase [Patescibacteria group bacterium]MDD5121317.1 flippase [Patescibacteria group bacterium]MDD5221802.1 flippase [Patescibacteria group bacterium]MDD5395764.1 flippase [Patescibacteria group bacterium]